MNVLVFVGFMSQYQSEIVISTFVDEKTFGMGSDLNTGMHYMMLFVQTTFTSLNIYLKQQIA